MEKSAVPELRFPGFEGDWVSEPLGNNTFWSSGGTPPKENSSYWDGSIPWISAASMHSDLIVDSALKISLDGLGHGSKLAQLGSVLVLVRGSMLFKRIPIGLVQADVAFNQDVKSLVPKENISTAYLFYWLKSKEHKLLSMVVGTGIGAGKLDTSGFKALSLSITTKSEQQKIAAFLGSVDDKLTALRRKHELLQDYKRSMMQKIFSRELRFKRDDGFDFPDWEEKRLGEVAERCTQKNSDCSISRVLTNSATQGIVDQRDYFDKDIANADNLGGYYIVGKGDYVYNPRISVHAPVGPIKKNLLGKGIMSPLYTVFRFNDRIDEFFEQYFRSTFWHKYMCSVANYGARYDRMNITTKDFMAIPLPWPHCDEQQKIVDFLSTIDTKIEIVGKQIDQLETFKKGLLQKMFV